MEKRMSKLFMNISVTRIMTKLTVVVFVTLMIWAGHTTIQSGGDIGLLPVWIIGGIVAFFD
jgi:hypothetical protein